MTFTAEQKLEAVRRELKLRKKVYPRRISTGRMTPSQSDWELSIMRAIEEDYEALAAKERLL